MLGKHSLTYLFCNEDIILDKPVKSPFLFLVVVTHVVYSAQQKTMSLVIEKNGGKISLQNVFLVIAF